MSGGKGSGRRPQQVPDDTMQDSWNRIFGNKKEAEKSASNHFEEKEDDGKANPES